jgi:hypothetical protein
MKPDVSIRALIANTSQNLPKLDIIDCIHEMKIPYLVLRVVVDTLYPGPISSASKAKDNQRITVGYFKYFWLT